MRRRAILRAITLASMGALLPEAVRSPAPSFAQQISLAPDDLYWLCSVPWLAMISAAEGTLHLGEKGYRTIYGYRFFSSYADHPRRSYPIPGTLYSSDATGKYQFLSSTYDKVVKIYPDVLLAGEEYFSPANQDRAALALSFNTGASATLMSGVRNSNNHITVSYAAFKRAVYKDSSEWASLPGHDIGKSTGQHTKPLDWLWEVYQWHLWGSLGYWRKISFPLPNKVITSHYGPRWGDWHSGIDYACAVGTPVRSPEPAKVIKVSEDERSGKYIVLSPIHFPELQILFCHLSKSLVKAGDQVDGSTAIALSGATGKVTGPHLHAGLWIGDDKGGWGQVNPYRYFEMSEWFA